MTEKPILFSGPMVRAILEGRKTMTRRVLKPQPVRDNGAIGIEDKRGKWVFAANSEKSFADGLPRSAFVFRYAPGDLLWVRENGWQVPALSERELREGADTWPKYAYDADDDWPPHWLKGVGYKRHPSIFMPRWASRITLRVTAVKVERLQDISEKDAKAEGIFARGAIGDDPVSDLYTWQQDGWRYPTPYEAFKALWNSVNGPGAWDANPWVAAYSFEKVTP